MLGRALQDYFSAPRTARTQTLEQSLRLYHSIRYPRAERVQITSRQAGDLYQLKTKELAGLDYEEALPIVKAMIQDRMKWIWAEDIDKFYEQARLELHRSQAAL